MGLDYESVMQEVVFTPSNSQQLLCISVNVSRDQLAEGPEVFGLRLVSSLQGGVVLAASSSVTVTISDSNCKFPHKRYQGESS